MLKLAFAEVSPKCERYGLPEWEKHFGALARGRVDGCVPVMRL